MIKRRNILTRLRSNVFGVKTRREEEREESMIERRSLPKQVLKTVLTLGIYAIYWFYVTSKEMVAHGKLNGRPGVWTILQVIPIVNFYSFWRHSRALEAVTDGKYRAFSIFVLWIIFPPAVWWITQRELNRLAEEAEMSVEAGVGEEVEAIGVPAIMESS